MNGHSDAVAHGIEPFPTEESMEQEYWETVHKRIDECFIHAGRMSKTTDLMTEAANLYAGSDRPKRKHKYADLVIPF